MDAALNQKPLGWGNSQTLLEPWMNGENWMNSRSVFVTGGTGYLGQQLIHELLARGYQVRALAWPGSEGRLPPNCVRILGDALDPATYHNHIELQKHLRQSADAGRPGSHPKWIVYTNPIAAIKRRRASHTAGTPRASQSVLAARVRCENQLSYKTRERLTRQPSIGFYNLFNFPNFDLLSAALHHQFPFP